MSKKCIDCKHLNKELAFCRACGAKWLKETDGEYCKYFEKSTSPTVFDRITQSPEVLAEKLVYEESLIKPDGTYVCRYFSTIIGGGCWLDEEEAYAATVAKLKEFEDEKDEGEE